MRIERENHFTSRLLSADTVVCMARLACLAQEERTYFQESGFFNYELAFLVFLTGLECHFLQLQLQQS